MVHKMPRPGAEGQSESPTAHSEYDFLKLEIKFAGEDEETEIDMVEEKDDHRRAVWSQEEKNAEEERHYFSGVGALRKDPPETSPAGSFREKKTRAGKVHKEKNEEDEDSEEQCERDEERVYPCGDPDCKILNIVTKSSGGGDGDDVQNEHEAHNEKKGGKAKEETSKKNKESNLRATVQRGINFFSGGIEKGKRIGRNNIRGSRRRGGFLSPDSEHRPRERRDRSHQAGWNDSVEVSRSPSRSNSIKVSPSRRSPIWRSPSRRGLRIGGNHTELSSEASTSTGKVDVELQQDEATHNMDGLYNMASFLSPPLQRPISPMMMLVAEPVSRPQSRPLTPQPKKTQELPRPLPPMLSSADHQSITLEWVEYPMALCYHIEMAPKNVAPDKVPFKRPGSPDKDLLSRTPEPMSWKGNPEKLGWVPVYCGKDISYKVENLKPGREYQFRVRIGLALVSPITTSSPSSKAAVYLTLPCSPDVPSAPSLMTRCRTSLKVKWNPPAETGGVPITEYWLEMSPPPALGEAGASLIQNTDDFVRVYSGVETSAKVTRLSPGTAYRFRVLAANSTGQSTYSGEGMFKTAASVPASPLPPTLLSKTATSISVTWEEPNDCGSSITCYTVERDVGKLPDPTDPNLTGEGGPFSVVYIGDETSCFMEGLKSGHMYRVRVAAQNEVGKGAYSAPAEYLTSISSPHAPPAPSITGRSTSSVSIVWQPPDVDGGSPITAYDLEIQSVSLYHIHSQGHDTTVAEPWILSYYGPGTAHTLTGLLHGQQYRVRVRAVNLMGKGGFSSEAPFSTAPGCPETPLAPVPLDCESRKCTLGWRPPHNGGSTITAYRLEMQCVPEDVPGNTGSTGSGMPEEARGFVCVYRGTETSFVMEGLRPGTSYGSRLQAYNKLGVGPWSSTGTVKTPPALPCVPAPPIAASSPTPSSISLKWSPPECNGAAIETYQLQMLMLGGGDKHVYTHELIFPGEEVTTPTPGGRRTNLQIRIPEYNPEDDSVRPLSEVPLPSPTRSVSSESSYGSGSLESKKFAHNRLQPIDSGTRHNELEQWKEESERSFCEDKGPSNIDGLIDKLALHIVYDGPATTYTARNLVGASGFSPFTVATTAATPPCPPGRPSAVKATMTSLTLQWEVSLPEVETPICTLNLRVPGQSNGSPVNNYSLHMAKVTLCPENDQQKEPATTSTGSKKVPREETDASTGTIFSPWEEIYLGPALQHKVVDLMPARQYSFQVVAYNDVGASSPSPSLEISTCAAAPEAPDCPTFGSVTPTSVRIRWIAPPCDNGAPITSYRLMMDDGKVGQLVKVYEGRIRTYKATNLVPTLCYRAAVQAFNSLGASFLSECSSITLPMAPPATPPIPKFVAASEKSITIHWLKQFQDPGGIRPSNRTAYLAEGITEKLTYTLEVEDCNPGGKITKVYEGTNTRYEMKWAVADHVYRFRVRANAFSRGGCSQWSSWSTGMTMAKPPTPQPTRQPTPQLTQQPTPQASPVMSLLSTPIRSLLSTPVATPVATRGPTPVATRSPTLQLESDDPEAPQTWSLPTRRIMALIGVAATLGGAIVAGRKQD